MLKMNRKILFHRQVNKILGNGKKNKNKMTNGKAKTP